MKRNSYTTACFYTNIRWWPFVATLLVLWGAIVSAQQATASGGPTDSGVVVTGAANSAPVVSLQPVGQTVECGSDVVLSVMSSSVGQATYQWYHNKSKLVGLEGVAGFTSPQLYLVSPSQGDAGSYSCVITGNGGAVTSAVAVVAIRPTVVFSDSISTLANWSPLISATALELDSSRNHGTGTGFSLHATNSSQRMFHRLPKLHGAVTLSFWLFDDGSQQPILAVGTLRAHNAEIGYANFSKPWGLEQSLDIGLHSMTRDGTGGGILKQQLDTTKYQGRVLRGVGTNTIGWFNLSIARSPGWHRMEIRRNRDGSVVWLVDGVIGKRIQRGVKMADMDTVMLGCWGAEDGSGVNSGQVWFDDVSVAAYWGASDAELSTADGSPVPTLMKIRETGTNEVADVTVTTVAEVHGADTNRTIGHWQINGGDIQATDVRGFVQYSVNAPASDVYRLEIEGSEAANQLIAGQPLPLPLNIWCDGEYLGNFSLRYGAKTNGFVHLFTSYLTNGPHSISIEWDNAREERSLKISAVRLQSLPSAVMATNGMKAWVANRLAAQCGLEVAPPESFVSPVCIEGRDRYPSQLQVVANGVIVPTHHGAGYHFYANVALSPDAPTAVEASFQDDAFHDSKTIQWVPTELFTCTNNILLRRGDELLLSALPEGVTNGTMLIGIGQMLFTNDVPNPVRYKFDQAGTFVVTGSVLGSSDARSVTVKVVDVSLDPVVPVFTSRAQWECTNLPPEIVVQSDPRLKFHRLPAEELNQSKVSPTYRAYRIDNAPAEPMYVVARLRAKGPILANAAVQGFQLHIPPETELVHVASRQDGSELVDETIVLSPIGSASDISLHCQILTGGITFDTGELSRTLTAANFDPLGVCHFTLLRSPTGRNTSICNHIKVYHKEVLVDRK
jgi:hypothetical protein